MSQYLEFEEIEDTEKTKVIAVTSKSKDSDLALIKWYGPWRCYVLEPVPGTIWNDQCLMDVNSYISRLKAERSLRLEDGRKAKA